MVYLSELLNKKIFYDKKVFGEMVDFAVLESTQSPSVSKVVIKRMGKKLTISPTFLEIRKTGAILRSNTSPLLPFDERDFYLNEDLLDKQVIDVDDKRVVRVNDILLENNGELKVIGIDVGVGGILRRLSLEKIIKTKAKILPWQMIEAFDYQTGNIKISLTQSKLNSLHPSEIADILEELGSNERRGIVESLDAGKAAKAIGETDFRTQEAILETLPSAVLKKVVARMHVADIAQIFYKLNPLRIREILKFLGSERAKKVERLLDFGLDTAGASMRTSFPSFDGNISVKEVLSSLSAVLQKPEAVVITNGNQRVVGIIYTKDLLNADPLSLLKDIVSERKFVYAQSNFNQVISLFGKYNLRLLPVVDRDKKPIGVITAGIILSKIEEKTKDNEFI